MALRKVTKIAAATLAAGALALSSTPANAAALSHTDTVPTYQEFRDAAYVDSDGQFIVNGDEPLANEGALRKYYDALTGATDTTRQSGGSTELIVNRVSGRDDKWSATAVRNLTYCVSTRFGTQQSAVVTAMAQGAALWENASSAIDFRYVSAQNSNCNTRNTSVVFSVEPTSTSQYIARAFFPSSSKSSRNVLVNPTSLRNSGWAPGNIMGHELGHTLGLRHEHTRPEAGTCFEDNNWRALTPYDRASIMHYPQCNGSSGSLSFTSTDGVGIRALYGS